MKILWAEDPGLELGDCAGAWCPECGPGGRVDEDGCCRHCGASAVGDGADQAHRWKRRAEKLVAALIPRLKREREARAIRIALDGGPP